MITFKDGNAGHTLHAGVFPATYLGAHREQSVRGGLGGFTSGPVAFGLDVGDLASGPLLVLSPLNAFMAALHNIGSANRTLSWGVGGLMAKLPRGYSSDFVAVIHGHRGSGSNSERYSGAAASAFMAWGDFLLREYGQVRTRPDANAWISQLGYSTTGTFHCALPLRQLLQLCHCRRLRTHMHALLQSRPSWHSSSSLGTAGLRSLRRQPMRLPGQSQPKLLRGWEQQPHAGLPYVRGHAAAGANQPICICILFLPCLV